MDLGHLAEDLPDAAQEPEAADSPAHAFNLHELAGRVGAEVAAPLSAALERVNSLATTGRIGRSSMRALREEIEQARKVAMMGQQIARLASGRVRQNPKAIDLPQMLRDLLTQRGPEIETRGLVVRQVLKPAVVKADATLMFTLLQGLFDWVFEHACERHVEISTEVLNWPVHAELECEFAWRRVDEVDTDAETQFEVERREGSKALDTMAWRLTEQVAQVLGVRVARGDSAWQARVTLEFVHPLEDLPVLMTGHGELEDPYRLDLNSMPLAGSHVLVVAPRREIRNLVREALRPMGLMVDFVTTTDEAREFCRGSMPHAVIYDGGMAGFEALMQALLAEVPNVAFVEINEGSQAMEVAASGRCQQVRLGLGAVLDSLPSALQYALSRHP